MRLFALTVGRNERYRYLAPMLAHMKGIVDGHFFYDDQSDDGTEKLAKLADCRVVSRRNVHASFVQDEGRFREDAWFDFESEMDPELEDWVLVIDCDEFLVNRGETDVYKQVRWEISVAETAGATAIDLAIPEVFGLDDDGTPLIRTDRLWGTIHAPRLFKYRHYGTYYHGEFGVPAVPNYVMGGQPWASSTHLALMHYGYAREKDQLAKYERYSGRAGHGDAHVQSIISPDKELVRWPYPSPSLLVSPSTS